MPTPLPKIASILCLSLLHAAPLRADDPIVPRAMTATTIAEVFVEEGRVRIELEAGVADLKAFADLLPDEVRDKLRLPATAEAERHQNFFAKGLVLKSDRERLPGKLLGVKAHRRMPRDLVTGLPNAASKTAGEAVLRFKLEYEFTGKPKRLSLSPPTTGNPARVSATIGFVLYHLGLPVNDFRYLSKEESLDLDWKDPWFSRFDNRNLWRKYAAPISAFLYVSYGEVRKEIVIRPLDLQRWVDLGLEGKEKIGIEEQAELKRRAAEFLAKRSPVRIDGREYPARLDRVHFLQRSLRKTGVIDPPEVMDVHSALLGVIFAYDIEGLPKEVSCRWDLFHEKFPKVPGVATDEAGGLPGSLTAEDPDLVWQNFLTRPQKPSFLDIPPPPPAWRSMLPWLGAGSLLLACLLAVLALRRWKLAQTRAWPLALPSLAAGLSGVALLLLGGPGMAPAQNQRLLQALLHNIYRSFDHHQEEIVYDMLARTVDGDLLRSLYLDTRSSLAIEQQGGAQAKVRGVEMLETAITATDGGSAFETDGTWIVSGSVGHWGHIHERRLRYKARFKVRAIDGTWKITAMDVLEEERVL